MNTLSARLCAGMDTLGVLGAVKQHPAVFRALFTAPKEAMAFTGENVEAIFKVGELGTEGSNARVRQLEVIGFWRDLLQDIEG